VIERSGGLLIIRLASFGRIFSQPLTPIFSFWFRRLKYDIVHLHLPNPLAVVFYLLAHPGGRLIVSYHGDIVRQRFASVFLTPLFTRLLRKAEVIVVSSENLINASSFLKKFRDKCSVIPYGIDIDRFRPSLKDKEEARKIREIASQPVILFVGRLVYYKGLKYLIKAMSDINARLLIVGTGPLGYRLKLLARLAGVSNKITWLGEVADERLPVYYNACDLFVLPSCSNSESFGLVILEAHACGKPVVSTNLPTGVTFSNLHEDTGLVVPSKDPQGLREAMQKLLLSEELRGFYGSNGRIRVEREFTKEMASAKFLTLYNAMSNN
jgi:rhamnosyl/mannosyltransferase